MKVEVKKIDEIKRELRFEVPKERVSKTLEEVYQEIGKSASVKGFRQGKVPRHILESHFGRLAQENTFKKIIPEVYQEGVKEHQLEPLDLPEISDVAFKDGVITFSAKLDIKPEVRVKDYKGIVIKKKSSEVTEEEINKTLDLYKQAQGKDSIAVLDDSFARGMGYPNLEAFRQYLAKQMALDKDRHNRIDVENQIIETVLKNARLTVPGSLIKKQIDKRLKDIRSRFAQQEIPEEERLKKEKELLPEIQKVAERDIRVFLTLDRIAEMEGLSLQEGEGIPGKVMEFLLKEAKWEA